MRHTSTAIKNIKELFPSLQSVSVRLQTDSFREAIYVLNQDEARFIDSVTLGKYKEESYTIVKHYCKIFFNDSDNNRYRFVKAKKMVFQYNAGRHFISFTKDLLFFKGSTYLHLEGVSIEDKEQSCMQDFTPSILESAKRFEKFPNYMGVLNRRLDFLKIRLVKASLLPNPN